MKTTTGFLSKAAAIALVATCLCRPADGQLTVVGAGYTVIPYYTHNASDSIISYDWDAAANLEYMTSAGFPDVAVWKATGAAPLSIYANSNDFAGASVLRIGDFIYFNDSDLSNNQFIRGYGPLSGSASVTTFSTTPNYGLYRHNGELFITGSGASGGNQIYYSDLAGDGHLLNDPAISLGTTGGGSGPLAFDDGGNMFFAPGYGDSSIYKWSALEVANAVANPVLNPLSTTGHLWLDYSGLVPAFSGATSMLMDPTGELLVTLTNFSDPSELEKFGTNPDGSYNGAATTILTDSGLVGELRQLGGNTYVSAENQIVQIVPEPGDGLLVCAGLPALVLRRRRRRTRVDHGVSTGMHFLSNTAERHGS